MSLGFTDASAGGVLKNLLVSGEDSLCGYDITRSNPENVAAERARMQTVR